MHVLTTVLFTSVYEWDTVLVRRYARALFASALGRMAVSRLALSHDRWRLYIDSLAPTPGKWYLPLYAAIIYKPSSRLFYISPRRTTQ